MSSNTIYVKLFLFNSVIYFNCFKLFKQNVNLMLEDLEKGDVAETIRIFFEKSNNVDVKPASKSTLTLAKVNSFLDKLSNETTEVAQTALFKSIATL